MAELQLYDTMSREKRRFEPADPSRVRLYVCGPTVYNYAHIGNARPVVVFDVLFRLLRHLYGEDAVIYARNITDVDDKINAKAAEEGVPIKTITDRYTAIYHQDMDALGALRPTLEPRATDHIPEMIELIGRLMDAGHAYAAEGHVLFDVGAFPEYGRLSGRSLDDMIAGARVEVAPYKKNPADFVLWKPSKLGEPEWKSPWGAGRPGWHLECSAMIEAGLGPLPIDIHGGGLDLIFPHHENEIAQSMCADHPSALANYWMHNGFLDMAGEKMSKSLGNVLLVHELVERVPGEVLRLALLLGHYRQPLSLTDNLVYSARRSLDRLYGGLLRASEAPSEPAEPPANFLDALLDDLNTPTALGVLFHMKDQLETAADDMARSKLKSELLAAGALLGLLQADPQTWFQGRGDDELRKKIELLIANRTSARQLKDWAEADRLRAELTELGVEVMDGPLGATWRFKEPAPSS
jgi:cysteinyl-tRNA synthetase